jgi:hypothetical protein
MWVRFTSALTSARLHADGATRQAGDEFQQLVALHLRPHELGAARFVHPVDRKDVLGEINADEYDGHGLPLPQVVDESSNFPSWHRVADTRNTAGTSGRGSPLYSLGPAP